MAAIVIADASPLIALARVQGLPWLRALFHEVLVTDTVLAEVLTGTFPENEAPLQQAIREGWLKPVNGDAASVEAVNLETEDPPLPDLDEGEAASIRLALRCEGPVLLLIDERAGRAVAQELGLKVAGTAAVIGLARQRGLLRSARAVFKELHTSDFRIAPAVIQTVLERCGE